MFLVPTLVYALIDANEERARYDLSSLQMIVYGAAPMSPDRLLEAMAIFGSAFVQIYGQTVTAGRRRRGDREVRAARDRHP